MSESGNKSQRNRDIAGENETLFDFLKRKKKYNLENTVNKSLYHHSYTKKKIDMDVDDDYPEERTKHTHNYQSNNQAYRATRETITPKKIDFQEPRKNKSIVKEGGKSFLSMISPLKGRNAVDERRDVRSALEERKEEKENVRSVRGKKDDSFSRKNVTKCINSIKQSMNTLSDAMRGLKEKSHGLVFQFNPLFNYVAEANVPISRQVGQFRNKLKTFQTILDAVQIDHSDQMVENFHKNLEEHLQAEEGLIRRSLEKEKDDEVNTIKSEKEKIIERLQLENKKLLKQLDLAQRRLQKVENYHGNMEEAVTEREINSLEQMDRLKTTYQATVEQLKTQNQQLTQKCEDLTQKNKYWQKQSKNQRFTRQSYESKWKEEVQHVIEAKDAYLLNEIMVLKAQFGTDLQRITELHRVKEAELIGKVEKKDIEISRLSFERGCDKQIQTKILEEANAVKQQNVQLKTKTDCIITDMYRMNEELYQHWMALKDIKALSTRLGSFPQYSKIYQDLLFNDHLFH